eukprot:m.182882 g.182882  ORF g.182882 m.182882 type:complete len:763 (-) comp15646_c0_seq1:18-2306(-)
MPEVMPAAVRGTAAPGFGPPAAVLGRFKRAGQYPKVRLRSLGARGDGPAVVSDEPTAENNWRVAWRAARQPRQLHVRPPRKPRKVVNGEAPELDADGLATGVLNRRRILKACCADQPSEVCTAKVVRADLVDVDITEIAQFTNLVHIDCSENFMQLHMFARIPKLEVLELGFNHIEVIRLPETAVFESLTILDMSHNELQPDAILQLRTLPKLKSLDLTANKLSTLPLSLTSEDFPALENLVLDHNRLSSVVPFQAFALLPKLEFLSLSRNRIEFVPRLVDGGDEDEEEGDEGDEGKDGERKSPLRPADGAFVCLKTLCVTHNRIDVAADVLNAGYMPSLESLLLWGNPLAVRGASLPMEVTVELVERCGIDVEHKEPGPMRGPILPDREDLVRVQRPVLPAIRMGGALRALEQAPAPPKHYLEYVSKRPPSSSLPLPRIHSKQAHATGNEDAGSAFLTQAQFSEEAVSALADDTEIFEPRNPYRPVPNERRVTNQFPAYFSAEHAIQEARRLGISLPDVLEEDTTPSSDDRHEDEEEGGDAGSSNNEGASDTRGDTTVDRSSLDHGPGSNGDGHDSLVRSDPPHAPPAYASFSPTEPPHTWSPVLDRPSLASTVVDMGGAAVQHPSRTVPEDFEELFRLDPDELVVGGDAEPGTIRTLALALPDSPPQSMDTAVHELRFALEHPLSLRVSDLERKRVVKAQENDAMFSSRWQPKSIDAVLNKLDVTTSTTTAGASSTSTRLGSTKKNKGTKHAARPTINYK